MEYSHEFKNTEHLIYLNHAAVAPWPARTADAVKTFADENLTIGARRYPHWLKIEHRLRHHIARLINAPSADNIALLKNTSEGLSVIAYGMQWQPGDNIVTSNQEFPSNRLVWESLATQGVELRQADLYSAPTPEEALLAQIDEHTRLLTISSVEYASGLRIDLERLGVACRERGIFFCVDAIQSIGALQFDVQKIGADFVIADGHKWMLGPEGLALFYCRPEAMDQLNILQYGWHMVDPLGDYDNPHWKIASTARRFECGSPNMLGIHALEASLGLLLEIGMESVEQQLLANSEYLMELVNAHPRLELLSDSTPGRYAGIVTFKPDGVDLTQLYQELMEQGVICAMRGGGIRFSPHFYTGKEQLEQAIAQVDRLMTA